MKGMMLRLFLSIIGWRAETPKPTLDKYLIIVAPHTSNWDLPIGLCLVLLLGMQVSWFGKHQLFEGPLGRLLSRLGGIPIRRDAPHDVVRTTAELFDRAESLALVIAPEGTRRRAEYWKSGFLHIARSANVPIVPAYMDYGRKRGGFGPAFMSTGDVKKDMDHLREFYSSIQPKYRELAGPIRVRREDAD